jgi:hypothetical protein
MVAAGDAAWPQVGVEGLDLGRRTFSLSEVSSDHQMRSRKTVLVCFDEKWDGRVASAELGDGREGVGGVLNKRRDERCE